MPALDHSAIVKRALRLARSDTPSLAGDATTQGPYSRHADLQTRILRLLPTFGAGVLQAPNIYASVEHREDACRFALDFYEGRMVQYLDKMPDEEPEDFERRRGKFTLPLTSAIIDTLARLYDGTPVRTTEDEEYLSWLGTVGADALLQIGERYTTLQGNGCWRVLFSEDRGLYPEYLTSEQVRTVPNPEDPSSPLAVIVRWHVDNIAEAKVERYATIYTRDEIIPLRDGEPDRAAVAASGLKPGPSGFGYVNPYRAVINGAERGVLPMALSRYRLIGRDWHCDGEGQYLSDANAEINDLYAAVFNQAYMQGFTPVVFTNRDAKTPMKWGPGVIIDIRANKGEASGAGTVQLDSHITELMALIADTINRILEAKRIPESALHATADASGVSIVSANSPLTEFRRASIPRWQRFEHDAYIAWAAVNAYHFGGPIPNADEMDLGVQWPEPAAAVSPADKAADEDRRMGLGLLSVVDIELAENGDAYSRIDDEPAKRKAALAALLARKAENEAVNPAPVMGGEVDENGDPIDPESADPNGRPDPDTDPSAADDPDADADPSA